MPGVKLVSLMFAVGAFALTGLGDFRAFSQEKIGIFATEGAAEAVLVGDLEINADDGRPRAVAEPAICNRSVESWTMDVTDPFGSPRGTGDGASVHGWAAQATGISGGLSSPPVVCG